MRPRRDRVEPRRFRQARFALGEVWAYARSGLYTTLGPRFLQGAEGAHTGVGVLFVHGVGANATQFRALGSAIAGIAARLDAFEYRSRHRIEDLTLRLEEKLAQVARESEQILVIGHSLGGLLARAVLQRGSVPSNVTGFVSICAPLNGTTRARFALSPNLRALSPGSEMFRELEASAARLQRLERVLAIGAERDLFLDPIEGAFLPAHPALRLTDTGHVGSLFDPRVHEAVREVLYDLARARQRRKLSSLA